MANETRMQKGQSIPLDFMVALFLFLLLMTYFILLWDIYSVRYKEQSARISTELSAIIIADQLVSSPGSPENWTLNATGAQSIGLAISPNRLDWGKAQAFSAVPYAYQKILLGSDKEFYMKIEGTNGVLYFVTGAQPANASRAIEVVRVATLNSSAVFVKVQVYE